jgi:hypothetical protein
MLLLQPNGDVVLTVRAPLVYLDHWALRRLGRDAYERSHLLKTFEKQGTLMFSLMNVLELGRNTGASYDQVTSFLDDLGPHWLLTESDSETCSRAETLGIPQPNCFLTDKRLVAGLLKRSLPGVFKLGTALRSLQGDDFQEFAARNTSHPELMAAALRSRDEYLNGRAMPPLAIPKGSPRWIHLMLLRTLVKAGKTIQDNDFVDALHAGVALAYAHVVTLDKNWAEYANQLRLSQTLIFKEKNFRDALKAIRSSRISTLKQR